MTLRAHLIFWSTVIIALFAFIAAFKPILLPFVLAFAISYFLEPVIKFLNGHGLNRSVAALIILVLFFLVVGIIIAAILPIAYQELIDLSADLPTYKAKLFELIEPISDNFKNAIGQTNGAQLQDFFVQHVGTAADVGKQFVSSIWAGGQAFVHVISLLVITPIIAYFVMREWTRISDWIFELMPRDQKSTMTDLLKQIDQKVSGFVRGQLSVALVLGIVYAIALSIAGLKYGVLVGLIAGFLNIIPLFGSTVGLLAGTALAWFQTGDWVFTGTIAAIFLVGQIIEGNFLSPKLIGDSVGMHPLWIFFSLMAGGALFGILGMVIAIPVVAIAGVLIAFAISQYKTSRYYKGKNQAGNKPKNKSAKKKSKKKNA